VHLFTTKTSTLTSAKYVECHSIPYTINEIAKHYQTLTYVYKDELSCILGLWGLDQNKHAYHTGMSKFNHKMHTNFELNRRVRQNLASLFNEHY